MSPERKDPVECDYESILSSLEEDDALRVLLEGTATVTGEQFFVALVNNLSKAIETNFAWVTEYLPNQRRLKTLAFWGDGKPGSNFEIGIDNSPCEAVIDEAQFVHYPDDIRKLFPHSVKLKELGAVSYMGVPLLDLDRKVMGHLAVIDNRPMPKKPKNLALFKIFAHRAAAELHRIRADSEAKDREEKLSRLVDSTMDAIIELDENLNIVIVNPAAKSVFNFKPGQGIGSSFLQFFDPESQQKLIGLVKALGGRSEDRKHLWVPGGLKATDTNGKEFPAEATLSVFEMRNQLFYTLILRNINERIEAERKIRSLTEEAEYLKEEIKSIDNLDEIIGKSPLLEEILRQAERVASTNSTVLVEGETGTGKELIARTIHQLSKRSNQTFIKLNCAALPSNLVESELFGHEPGAFTGAAHRRKGRFELADRGTIFLDEISEIPMDVQAKLLRVLQEGQFERVGGMRTIRVDVRVIAATNRNLNEEVVADRFRADLYYRLNVYPLRVPPLRARREDIPLLANYFMTQISARIGKTIDSIPSSTMNQLVTYNWPGNVRELKNVLERAIITSAGDELRLPEVLSGNRSEYETAAHHDFTTLETVERQYITSVLQETGWRISGPRGAAKILDLNPSTLRYRIKKLGIITPWGESRQTPRT